jgi:L-fucose isomerase-like protein
MNALIEKLELNLVVFGAPKYLKNEDPLTLGYHILEEIEKSLLIHDIKCNKIIISSDDDINMNSSSDDTSKPPAIFFPISGSTQINMKRVANHFHVLGIGITYTDFFLSKEYSDKFLYYNAAPAAMEIYSILKRTNKSLILFTSVDEIAKIFSAYRSVFRLKNSTLLQIGPIEPWVLSSTNDSVLIKEKLGVNLVRIGHSILENKIFNLKKKNYADIASSWENNSQNMIDIAYADIIVASRLTIALIELMEEYNADGVSIACFDLLNKLKTTACLSVSYLNDSNNYIAGCEADLDIALTLMILKSLTGKPGWVANPMIEHNSLLRLSHCTAPRYNNKYKYDLLNHHESSIGVSPRIYLPENEIITLARFGNNLSTLNIFTGKSVQYDYKNTCRTQIVVSLDNYYHYLESTAGCHQAMVFGSYNKELEYIAQLLRIK